MDKKVLSTITLVFIIQLFAYSLFAQPVISGRVVDFNGNPISGANVVIKNTTLGTATDNNGEFKLSVPLNGYFTIRVSFFGYGTVERIISSSQEISGLEFVLIETPIDMNAVVVTGTRSEKTLKSTPVLTQAVLAQEIERRGAQNIVEALEMTIPGIEFSSQAQGKSLSLQGIDPQYVVFLVNGERLAGDTYGDIDYSRIGLANIERIEVVKGASSTLYGSNALGGVVNIITKYPVERFSLSASSLMSKYNTQNYRLSTGIRQGKLSSLTSVNFDKTDGYDLLEGNSYRTQEKEDALVLDERLSYALSSHLQLEGNVSFMNKNRENTSPDLYDRRNKDFTYGLKGTWLLKDESNVTLSWHSDNYQLFDKVPAANEPDSYDLQKVYDNLYNNARLQGNLKINSWNKLIVGTEYLQEKLTASRNNIDNKTNTDYIIYAQEDLQLFKRLNLLAGARANHNSVYGWQITPQFSAMYKLLDFTFRGSVSRGYKTPSLKEKYMNFQIPAPGPPMFLVGNENLEPEKSFYTSLSAEYSNSKISVSVIAYQNKIEDMITEDLDSFVVKPGGIIEYRYENLNNVSVKGIDLHLKARIIKNLMFTSTATLSKKIDEITGDEFKNVRHFTGKFSLDYVIKRGKYRFDANLQCNIYGKKSISLMDEVTHQVNDLNLEQYSLWRLTTVHTLNNTYNIRLGIDNIFDYVDSSGGYNTGTPGRTFFLGLGVRI
jgi:outer membrane receptor for ferrienterochelin and colicins